MTPYYDEDGITIYLADCLEERAWLKADVLVTDPPYGVAYSSRRANQFQHVTIANDETLEARDAALEAWGERPAMVFGSWKMPKPAGTRTVLIWNKGTLGMGDRALPWFPCTEEIYVLGTGWVGSRTSAVLSIWVKNQYHPTEKPVPLIHALLGKCPPGTIADPFMGSGSTLVAAKACGRRAIGIEVDERYCEAAVQRLAQGSLFSSG